MEKISKKKFLELIVSIQYYFGSQWKKEGVDLLQKTQTDLEILVHNWIDYWKASKNLDFVYHLTRNHIQISRNTIYSLVWYNENEEEEMREMFEKIIWYSSRF